MGSVPPLDSTTTFDQIIPVKMWTDATFDITIDSSSLPNKRPFTRLTRFGVTTILVGKKRLPRVQRLAVKTVSGGTSGLGIAYTHSSAPFAQTQM